MRRSVLIAAAPLAVLAAPAFAQDALPDEGQGEALERLSETLSDPVRQQELAGTLAVLSEVLLDLPLAPLMEPLAEAAAEASGEEPEPVDPEMTLRRVAPRAGDLTSEIQDKLPRAMDGMAAMSKGFAAMLPALRQMSARMKDALPEAMRAER